MASVTFPPLPIATQIFTFYSFKGGVGRSMAVVNTAAQLARGGRRVLILDLDLEAPGVSYLARKQGVFPKRGGFVDILYDFLSDGDMSSLGNPKERNPFSDYTMSLNLGDTAQEAGGGTVTAMPAGNLADLPEYQRRVAYLELGRLYREGMGTPLFAHFKDRLCKLTGSDHFDYILVDSRTGFTAESTIAVRDLADHLVAVMGLNHQNVEGTCGFLKVLHADTPRPKTVTIVFSPVPLGEDALAEDRINIARDQISKAWPELGRTESIARLTIPYHPRLALDESPHQGRLTNKVLTVAYRNIYEHVRNVANDSLRSYSRITRTLLENGLAKDAFPYLARLLAENYTGSFELAKRALSAASDTKTQADYLEVLKPNARTSLDVADTLAKALATKGFVVEGDQFLATYNKHNPKDAFGWMARGRFLEDTPRRDESTACIKKATELAPNNSAILNNYACHLWEIRGLENEADEVFKRWLALRSEQTSEYGNFAEFCIALGRYDRAHEALLHAWDIRPPGTWNGHLLFCAALFCHLTKDLASERLQLIRIKRGLGDGFRTGAKFASLLSHTRSKLDRKHAAFYNGLSLMIANQLPVSRFARVRIWNALPNRGSTRNSLFVNRQHKKDNSTTQL